MKHHDPTKQELVDLELRYWQAVADKDAATALSLSQDPCLVVGAQGTSELGRDALATMFATARYKLKSFHLDKVAMRRLGEDVFALTYRVTEELSVEGEPISLEAFDSSVWVRNGKQWTCALHTESPAGDPFGRS